jgi:hypothetical protein
MSGEHNVRYWLSSRQIETHPVYIEKILAAAKRSNSVLSDDTIHRMIDVMQERLEKGMDIKDDDLS